MRALRTFLCLAGVVGLLVLLPAVHRSPQETYGGADPRLLVLEAAAAVSLLALSALGRPRAASILLAVVGVAWLVPEVAGTTGVPLWARTVADASVPLLAGSTAFALWLRGRDPGARPPRSLLVACAAALVAALARVLLVDPFTRVDCWRACEHNPLVIGDGRASAGVETVALTVLLGGLLRAASLHRRRRTRASAAGGGMPADLFGWVLAAALVLRLLVAPGSASSWSVDPWSVALFVLSQAAAVAWLAAVGRVAWTRGRLEARIARLASLLDESDGRETLVDNLRQAVRDPGLRVVYWAPSLHTFVDDQGRLAPSPKPSAGEQVTVVARNDQTVAAIVHARRVDGHRLERALGPALRLALENKQLHAATRAELDELARSRVRVVERAALERQRLERNLHDGAQQRAVSLALLVRLLAGQHPELDQATLRRAEVLTRTLTEELRRVARGIYPAVLADAGLAGAVTDLAEHSTDLPVVVTGLPEERFTGTVESTAYLVVRAALADAQDRGAGEATVSGARDDGHLRFSVEDDGADPPTGVAAELADQVSALGGSIVLGGTPHLRRLEVRLPCAS